MQMLGNKRQADSAIHGVEHIVQPSIAEVRREIGRQEISHGVYPCPMDKAVCAETVPVRSIVSMNKHKPVRETGEGTAHHLIPALSFEKHIVAGLHEDFTSGFLGAFVPHIGHNDAR